MTRAIPAAAVALAALSACYPGVPPLAPDLCPRHPCAWSRLGALLDSAIGAGAAPGGVVAVSHLGARYLHGSGRLALDDPTEPDGQTVYDLASLTKILATTTLAMLAVSEGRLELDAPVARYVPAFRGDDKALVTIRHLLTHTSGLRPDRPLWRQAPDARSALALVAATPLDSAPGRRTAYSDLGAIVLGQAVERVLGDRLDALARARVFKPLAMDDTRFRPPASWLPRVAATEYDTAWRGRIVRGQVHDEKAAFLGGVAGHAGLFGSAGDLLRFGEWMLALLGDGLSPGTGTDHQRWLARRALAGCNVTPDSYHPVCPSDRLRMHAREFTRRQDLVSGSSRALGWDTPSPASSAGTKLAPSSFGHTGFTGTSLWIDPTRGLVVALVSNRVHPTRSNNRHAALRIAVADLAATLADSLPGR